MIESSTLAFCIPSLNDMLAFIINMLLVFITYYYLMFFGIEYFLTKLTNRIYKLDKVDFLLPFIVLLPFVILLYVITNPVLDVPFLLIPLILLVGVELFLVYFFSLRSKKQNFGARVGYALGIILLSIFLVYLTPYSINRDYSDIFPTRSILECVTKGTCYGFYGITFDQATIRSFSNSCNDMIIDDEIYIEESDLR